MEEGSSFELDPLAAELARSANRLVSIEASADVSAVASVLLREPAESSLPIVEDNWSFIDPWGRGGGGGRCVAICDVEDEMVLMGVHEGSRYRDRPAAGTCEDCPQKV